MPKKPKESARRYLLYGGSVELEFEKRYHRYLLIRGEEKLPIPGVTSVIGLLDKSPQLMSWAANLASKFWRDSIHPQTEYTAEQLAEFYEKARNAHNEKKQEAADIGTMIHRYLEQFFRDGKEDESLLDDDRVVNGVNAALRWLRGNHVEKVAVERIVYSKQHGFCGTLDKLALVNGKLSILDWKSGKGIYPEVWLQLAGYQGANEEEFPAEKIEQRIVLHLDKETGDVTPHTVPRDFFEEDYAAFLAVLGAFKAMKGVRKTERPEARKLEQSWIEELETELG